MRTTWVSSIGFLAAAKSPADGYTLMMAAVPVKNMRKRFARLGGEIQTGTPEQTTEFLRAEYERWGKVIREAKIKAE